MAPNTVAATPLLEERPPFPLGTTPWWSALCCWSDAGTMADRTTGEQQEPAGTHNQVLMNSQLLQDGMR